MRPLLSENMNRLPDGVMDDHISGHRIGPPPPKTNIENQPKQHGYRRKPINEGDASLSDKHRVAKRSTSPRLTGSEQEHHPCGHRSPGNPANTPQRTMPN